MPQLRFILLVFALVLFVVATVVPPEPAAAAAWRVRLIAAGLACYVAAGLVG